MPETMAGHVLHRLRPATGDAPDPRHLALLRATALIASVVAFVIGYLDHSQGMATPWTSTAAPVMGGIYLLAALLLWLRGAWCCAIVACCLVATSLYFLGTLHHAMRDSDVLGLYALATRTQFMPLLYVAAFMALRRGAAAFSWAHYASTVLLYVGHHGWPDWRGLMPAAGDTLGHTWFMLLLAHPCYILALQYVTVLKGRLHQTAHQAQADKQRFLAMLSHEIRSPLQAMLGSIDLLALKALHPPEKRAIERLRHAANQLEGHLRDVTEFTRLDDPAWQLHPQSTDVNQLVREACDAWQAAASTKGLTLHCEIASSHEATLRQVWTDPQRLRQILSNLLSNAVKYTPSGEIRVSAGVSADGRQLRLAVSDTGVGIPGHELPRIFEPYVRLENQRAGRAEGSGLGLAVVRKLVDRLGGELDVDSQPDRGSRFGVQVPLHLGQ